MDQLQRFLSVLNGSMLASLTTLQKVLMTLRLNIKRLLVFETFKRRVLTFAIRVCFVMPDCAVSRSKCEHAPLEPSPHNLTVLYCSGLFGFGFTFVKQQHMILIFLSYCHSNLTKPSLNSPGRKNLLELVIKNQSAHYVFRFVENQEVGHSCKCDTFIVVTCLKHKKIV